MENRSPAVLLNFQSKQACQLLHNKFVVILGDSIQRSVYKDLIQLLQKDSLLTPSQMKAKGELCFGNDHLIEGGVLLGELHNGTHYREVRQYRTPHHLVRFYFITRVYSEYLESILDDFQNGPLPDVLVLNSCVWDISRYGPSSMEKYRKNLETLFNRLDAMLPSSCLVIWNMTMPLGRKVTGGFLGPEEQHLSKTLRSDVIQGNFYGAALASFHLFDVLDLHFHFRFDLGNRVKDGVHWNNLVHRRITNLLLAHLAGAWGVVIPDKKSREGPKWDKPAASLDLLPPLPPSSGPPRKPGLWRAPNPAPPVFCEDDSLFSSDSWGPNEAFSGFTDFTDLHFPPLHQDALNAFPGLGSAPYVPRDPSPLSSYPFHEEQSRPPYFSHQNRTVRRVVQRPHSFVMRRRSFRLRDGSPYRRACNVLYDRY